MNQLWLNETIFFFQQRIIQPCFMPCLQGAGFSMRQGLKVTSKMALNLKSMCLNVLSRC